ncbi:MAG: class I SAM-dependent methyltransferase [Steroidobacteraceae bacterium]
MEIAPTGEQPTYPESQVFEGLLPLDGARILELGCGTAELTRQIATTGRGRTILALEVDETQLAINESIADLPNVRFAFGGAEAIPAPDDSFDVVFMFKSLHHVPPEFMSQALKEIHRVLKRGGLAYISEPRYEGAFNDIVKLFHDELEVRQLAFAAVRGAVQAGTLQLVQQVFFQVPVQFQDFAEFESRMIGVTHTRFNLSAEVLESVRARFSEHVTADGASFLQPMRVDLLRKPVSPVA